MTDFQITGHCPVRVLAGSAPDIATLRLLAPRPDGLFVLVELNMPLELFTPGYHPFHSFESVGDFGVFHPMFGPFRFARIGDGAVQPDEASLQPGGRVSGRFDGIIDYYVCVETAAGFFRPPETPIGEDPGEPPPAEDSPASEPPAQDTPADDGAEPPPG